MNRAHYRAGLMALAVGAWLPCSTLADPSASALYATYCASCHGPDRLGGMGPALLPSNLGRLRQSSALSVILDGRPSTQMAGFREWLDESEAGALVDYIYQAPEATPTWSMVQIRATHHVFGSPPDIAGPVHDADPMNLFVVVELGDHHVTILDGDRLEPIHRFPTRFAVHGGPKYSADGRFVFISSRDGWVEKYDLWNLQPVAEIRAGINTRNLAVSGDDRYVMVANTLPHSLVLLNAEDLSLVRVIDIMGDDGQTSRASAVYAAPPRDSFIVALKDIPEIWEIQYGDDPKPVYNGIMHDYRMQEGLARQSGRFPVRRIRLEEHLDDFFFGPDYRLLFGAAREKGNGQVVQMDVGRKIAEIPLAGMPHLGSGITWNWQGRRVLATPLLNQAEVSVIDLDTFEVVKSIATDGPGFFMRSHENSRYAWVDVFFGPNRDAVHVIDKETLEITRTLKPSPGKTAAHVEFDRSGKVALLSIWDLDGELVAYDAESLVEIKRLPMVKPSGKYNVFNKITRSPGTSH